MQLHIEYSRVRNQLSTAIRLKQFKRFSDECQLPSWYIKQSVQNVHQLQQHTIKSAPKWYDYECRIHELSWQINLQHDTSLLNPSHRSDGKSHSTCSSSSFVRITRCYRCSHKSLLVEPVNTHFVFITQIIHCEDFTNKTLSIIITTTDNDVKNDVIFPKY